MTALATFRLTSIHCHDEGDGPGEAEPYLWTIFFKVDGTTTSLVVDTEELTVNLTGRASIIVSDVNSNHGNLGHHGVDAGENVAIPKTLGEWITIIRSIPVVLPPGISATNTPASVDGVAGYLAVLLEEDFTTSEDILTAHRIFNDEVRRWINESLATLSVDLLPFLTGTDPDSLELDALLHQIDVNSLVESLTLSIEDALTESVVPRIAGLVTAGFLINPLFFPVSIASANQDDFIGYTHGVFRESNLLSGIPVRVRWNENTGAEDGDWELFGEALAVAHNISSLRSNLEYARVDPKQGVRQILPNGGRILEWIDSLP